MRRLTPFRLAARDLRRFPLRSFFMGSGVMVGVGTLTVLVAVGERVRTETLERFKNMIGTFDTVIVRPGSGKSRGMVSLTNVPPTLRFEDAGAVSSLAGVKDVALVQNAFDVDVKHQDRSCSPAIFGVSSSWLRLRGDEVDRGRFLHSEEEKALARVAILGTDVERDLFPGEDPLGQTIRIGDVPFEVVGVLRPRGAGPAGGSLDNIILIPVTTASRRLFNRDFLTMLVVQLQDPEASPGVVSEITALLRDRHHIPASAFDDFTVTSPKAVLAQVKGLGSALGTTLEGIALIATLMGGVVVSALMLAAVAQRGRAIGICRSVGATRSDVLAQFLLEASLASGAGGAVGILCGPLAGSLLGRWTRLPPVPLWSVWEVWGLLLAVGVGLVFGAYPAWKAARVHPATALKP
jgi:ABC-type antimicrobial peptide transport system permease subunit